VVSAEFGIEENSTIIAGKPAHKLVYTDKRNGLDVMQLWTINEGKAYNITYAAVPKEYEDYYLHDIKQMVDTFEILPFSGRSSQDISDTNLSIYEGNEIRLKYPLDWDEHEKHNAESTTIVFRSPFDDKREPSYREVSLTMAIDVDSVHDAGTDYRVLYSRIPHNTWTGNWSRQLQETSAYDKIKVLEEYVIRSKLSEPEESYIDFSFDLDKVNSPSQYKMAFYITDYFVKDHVLCRLIDTTNWVIIPPPDFSMSVSPSSVLLRPGEEKNLELQIKGSTNLQSEASLSHSNKNSTKDLQINFIPDKMSIPPSGTGSVSLHLEANHSAKPRPYTIPIVANISFPTSITSRGGETFSNNRSVNIIETTNLTSAVLPPFTDAEKLNNFTKIWITPIQGIWTFLAGVGAVIAPFIITLYRRRKKEKTTNQTNEG
jgi:hypothetical protein